MLQPQQLKPRGTACTQCALQRILPGPVERTCCRGDLAHAERRSALHIGLNLARAHRLAEEERRPHEGGGARDLRSACWSGVVLEREKRVCVDRNGAPLCQVCVLPEVLLFPSWLLVQSICVGEHRPRRARTHARAPRDLKIGVAAFFLVVFDELLVQERAFVF
jgi:hypothetical protein